MKLSLGRVNADEAMEFSYLNGFISICIQMNFIVTKLYFQKIYKEEHKMVFYNHLCLMGNLTKDPELRYTSSQTH